jgi:hypothetical protein
MIPLKTKIALSAFAQNGEWVDVRYFAPSVKFERRVFLDALPRVEGHLANDGLKRSVYKRLWTLQAYLYALRPGMPVLL